MKERMLTVLVPIKDSDATIVETLPSVDVDNINIIYKHEGVYKRLWLNPSTNQYEYREVVDREFPYIGKPMEIFNFTYDSTRMGPAPTISAQGVMWFADKDENGEDVTLEGLWNQECHVSFNGENFYLKLIPTSTKDNEDARYKYDLDFVSERVVLENVYLYDVVQPYITETPVSESATFSFFGDVSELIKRINASLIRSGLAKIKLKSGVAESDVLTYKEWNEIGLGTYSGSKPIRKPNHDPQSAAPYIYFYPYYSGVYNNYLLGEIYALDDNNELIVTGYQCRLGLDDKGEMTTSDEVLLSYDNTTIYQVLQDIKDKFNLQYYVFREKDNQGEFTGNTIIMVADCEHDFADWDEDNDDFVRGDDGLPKTDNPFDYGSEDALLSKEKANTTEKIVTRMTGTGSSDNIPWHYPNPTGDGWLRPVFKRDGEYDDSYIDYPTSEGNTTQESVRYEKYLKNRIGDKIHYGRRYSLIDTISFLYDESFLSDVNATIVYSFVVNGNSSIEVSATNSWDTQNTVVSCVLKKLEDGEYVVVSDQTLNSVFLNGGICAIEEGTYKVIYNFTFVNRPTLIDDVTYYWYPEKETHVAFLDTWPLSFFTTQWASFLGVLPLWMGLIPIPGAVELAIINYFSSGFTVRRGSFVSTNPNLKYKTGSGNLKKEGWYDQNDDIVHPENPEENSIIYAFRGGDGAKTIGVDDVMRIGYGKKKYIQVTPINETSYSSTNVNDVINYLSNYVLGSTGRYKTAIISQVDNVEPTVDDFVSKYFDFSVNIYENVWARNSKGIVLSDYGLVYTADTLPHIHDLIEFRRVKYVTPQATLMPEVYIRTDGANRFYNAHNYYKDNHLLPGSADTTIGEEQVGANVRNPIYKEDESGSDSLHYDFENEYIQTRPHEYIEKFDDVRPSIKGQTFFTSTTISYEDFTIPNDKYYGKNDDGTYSLLSAYPVLPTQNAEVYITQRIDVVETFAYDELDNDEIWESESDGNVSGEYKHPYFFAKLRPMGFNLFDLALQEDMVLSMTTGHCGACNFKIGVDENTLKNPVQIWQYDVYHKEGLSYTKVYNKGDLRRYIDVTDLYYKIDGIYQDVQLYSSNTVGFLVPESYSEGVYKVADFDETDVAEGRVGNLKNKSKIVFEGDVVVNGRFIDSQQDTSENYVWVALYKDTESYGTLMPSANPDYIDETYSRYIEPKGHIYNNRKSGQTEILDDDDADKFVLVNIRMPQAYLRRAEHELSRQIVKYMFDHNYQKYNFSIKFSRIFLAQNESIDNDLNENSVLYVNFNRKTYRQYVKHYSYRMSEGDVLPEITVDLNEELLPTRTMAEKEAAAQSHNIALAERRMRGDLRSVESRITKRVVGKNDTVVVRGNIVNRDSAGSLVGLQNARQVADRRIFDTELDTERLDGSVGSLGQNVDSVGRWAVDVEYFMTIVRETMEHRLQAQCQQTAIGDYAGLWYDEDGQITTPTPTCYSPTIPELDIE